MKPGRASLALPGGFGYSSRPNCPQVGWWWPFLLRCAMSLDPSLKSASSLVRHRNVLTRAERLDKLAEQEKWNESKSVFGLPKVAHRKAAVIKAEKAPAEEGTAPAAPRAPAPGVKAGRARPAAAPGK